jgi:hypothetical protein
MQASISSGSRNDSALHGGWDTHSSALGLKTQQTSGLQGRLPPPLALFALIVLEIGSHFLPKQAWTAIFLFYASHYF